MVTAILKIVEMTLLKYLTEGEICFYFNKRYCHCISVCRHF